MARPKRQARRGATAATRAGAMGMFIHTHGGDGATHVRGRAARSAEVRAPREATPPTGGATGTSPRAPVDELLHDAKELGAIVRRAGTRLLRTGLDPRHLRELPERIELVAAAERAWRAQVDRITPVSLRGARDAALQLRIDMLAAARYLLRDDRDALAALAHQRHGDGSDELARDLRALARFYEAHAHDLSRDPSPADAVRRARELAAQLSLLVDAEQTSRAAQKARAHRNRMLALLGLTTDEIRAAGRFAFRHVPARLAIFRVEFERALAQPRQAGTSRRRG